MSAPDTSPASAPAPSAALPPVPPAIAALQAQSRALRAQLEAFDASVNAFAAGVQASIARADQQTRRSPDGAATPRPVFGQSHPSPSSSGATEADALERIPSPASPVSQTSTTAEGP